jgi:hypothetical protein
MWIPAQTTTPPRASTCSADGTSAPTGAKTIAASSSSGGRSSEPPAHSAPRLRANACPSVSPGFVNANTRRPWLRATWATMWAEAPKPYSPSRSGSPAMRRERNPINPAQRSGASSASRPSGSSNA